jgi:hypothetical protein
MGGHVDFDPVRRDYYSVAAQAEFDGSDLTRAGSQASKDFEPNLKMSEDIIAQIEVLGMHSSTPEGSECIATYENLTKLLQRLNALWSPDGRISHFRRFESAEDYAAIKTGDPIVFLGFEPGSRTNRYDPMFRELFKDKGMTLGDRFEAVMPDEPCADHPMIGIVPPDGTLVRFSVRLFGRAVYCNECSDPAS